VTRAYGVAFVVLLVVAGAALWWRHQRPVPPIVAMPAPGAAFSPTPPPAAPPPPPAIKHPLPRPEPPENLPPVDRADAFIENEVVHLLGRKDVREFIEVHGLARRFVATVNNLAGDDASASLWPVKPTPGHFQAQVRGAETVIGPANAARYTPFVRFAQTIDARRAVGLYRRLYPILQAAYEDLGFPGKYLNDRVVEVIDNLLATPAISEPIVVRRFAADGGGPPSALYIYADPSLEARSAGQKILLRVGHENAAVLTAKLGEIRAELVTRSAAAH